MHWPLRGIGAAAILMHGISVGAGPLWVPARYRCHRDAVELLPSGRGAAFIEKWKSWQGSSDSSASGAGNA
ncbi:MAG TPA: hypothetical protein PLB25_13645 [Rhodoferax sp.]|nr:hypothetical protein [Rhodoferax sp.]